MSKDETGSDEVRGLPGYPANNSIPSGFALPIPMAPAPTHLDEPEPADPWSSTWEDTTWHISGDTHASTNEAPVAAAVEGAEGSEGSEGPMAATAPTGPTPTSTAASMPPTTGSTASTAIRSRPRPPAGTATAAPRRRPAGRRGSRLTARPPVSRQRGTPT